MSNPYPVYIVTNENESTHIGPCGPACLCVRSAADIAIAMRRFRLAAITKRRALESAYIGLDNLHKLASAPAIRGRADAVAECEAAINALTAEREAADARRRRERAEAIADEARQIAEARRAYLRSLPR